MARIVLWAAFLVTVVYCVLQGGPQEIAVPLALLALGLWMLGCGLYGHAKGYSPVMGAALGIFNIIGLIVLLMLPVQKRRPPKEPVLLAGEFVLAAPRPKVPPDCLCCGNRAQPAKHVSGKSRRMWIALLLLLLVALAVVGVAGEGDLQATAALFGMGSYFVGMYALFYAILVFPVLTFSRRRLGELAGSTASVAAFGLLLLFIGYCVATQGGALPAVAIGAGVVVLAVVAIERICTVYVPLCQACYATARTSLKVVDYAPLANELRLRSSDSTIAARMASVAKSASRRGERPMSNPAAVADDNRRRPCPKCGRMNLDWISKCPSCHQKLS